jgi:hypothetical protein
LLTYRWREVMDRRTVVTCLILGATSTMAAGTKQTSSEECSGMTAGWGSIETAPKNKPVLLGLLTGAGFIQGVGRWEVRDELGAGIWSVEDWWGRTPTHWSPIPPPPGVD